MVTAVLVQVYGGDGEVLLVQAVLMMVMTFVVIVTVHVVWVVVLRW